MSTPRKTRSDKKVGTIEKELGIKLYGTDGCKIRKDKTLGELRKKKQTVGTKRKAPAGELTEDQKLAAKVKILMHPKSKISDLNKIRQAIRSLK